MLREAWAVYRTALKLDPADPGANRGYLAAALAIGDLEAASEHIGSLALRQPELSRDLAEFYSEITGKHDIPSSR
jgi:hypothetical protein